MTREETIKWLESLKAEIGKPEHRSLWHYAEAIDTVIEALKDQGRPKGEWNESDPEEMKCSVCGSTWNYCDNDYERFNFCPNCGSDNRERSEDK